MRTAALSIFVVGVLALAGCAAESMPEDAAGEPGQSAASGTPSAPEAAPEQEPQEGAAIQAEDCGWGSGPVAGDASQVPSGSEGALDVVLVGAWQHTHFDTGGGYEPLGEGTDIRYVFPSTERLLYCQDVEGATNQAQNSADITLNGTEIVMPSPATGYTVVAWSADTMVWENHRDGSHYLLKRR